MFEVLDVQPSLLERWIEGDRVAGREAARLYHDHVLLRKLGLAPIRPQKPAPADPLEEIRARLDLQEQLIRGLLATAAGDPDPRPNLSPLFDPAVRAEAARALAQKLAAAAEALERDARALERMPPPQIVDRAG